jgi:hydroxylaminobenzene mutase
MLLHTSGSMNDSPLLWRQGHWLIEVGVVLLLLGSLEGFVVPYLASPALALAAHRLAGLEGVLFIAFGAVWSTHLRLEGREAKIAFGLLVYSGLAILAAYILGAVWGAGNETMRMAAGAAHGTPAEELVIKVVSYSSATVLVPLVMIIRGLRR